MYIAVFIKTLSVNSLREDVHTMISVRGYLTDKSAFPTNSFRKWYLTSMCLLLGELNGCLAKAIPRLLCISRRPQSGPQKKNT